MIDDTCPPLAAWLHGERVADLAFDGRRGVQLQYAETAIERYGINGLALSASLPVRAGPYPPDASAPYLDRLLPEGAARSPHVRSVGELLDQRRSLARAAGDLPAQALVPGSRFPGRTRPCAPGTCLGTRWPMTARA